ncbi:MAG: hypothetical protein ACUVUR_02410 [bacterium]
MKQPICHLFAVLFLLALSLTCSSPSQPLPRLTTPAWQEGETSIYQVRRNDSVLFSRATTLEFDEESGTPIILFTTVVRSESVPYYFLDSTTFALTRFTLIPVWSYRSIATEVSISEVQAEFEPERVELCKEMVDGREEKTLRLGKGAYGIEMLPQLLRTIPLEPGLSFRVQGLVAMEFRAIPVTIKVLGTKMVNTPKGDILCREVEALAERRSLRLLYELTEPHRLIAILDSENSTETILIDFYIRKPETLLPER